MKIKRSLAIATLLVAAVAILQTGRRGFGADGTFAEINSAPGAFKDAVAHVQGFCCDEDAIYAVFLNKIYKLDWNGNVVKSAESVRHAGDPCLANEKLYVAMACDAKEAIHEYDLDLNLLRKIKLEEVETCDGIAFLDGKFYIGGSKGQAANPNTPIFIYDEGFNFVKKEIVNFGVKTNWTTQSNMSWNGKIFCAFYIDKDNPKGSPRSICIDKDCNILAKFQLDGSNGWCLAPGSRQSGDPNKPIFLVCKTYYVDKEPRAKFLWYEFDNETLTFKNITMEQK
ncbi:MAG: hypothetical protein IJM30_11085 [Thermoguttaceae bacterium]|nr:hypothetical protein [Thermoguttaceae bacterium]